MSIIKAKKCEVEIQEQTIEGAAAKYVVILSYEPENEFSKEIISIVLTNHKPYLKETIDTLENDMKKLEERIKQAQKELEEKIDKRIKRALENPLGG